MGPLTEEWWLCNFVTPWDAPGRTLSAGVLENNCECDSDDELQRKSKSEKITFSTLFDQGGGVGGLPVKKSMGGYISGT